MFVISFSITVIINSYLILDRFTEDELVDIYMKMVWVICLGLSGGAPITYSFVHNWINFRGTVLSSANKKQSN